MTRVGCSVRSDSHHALPFTDLFPLPYSNTGHGLRDNTYKVSKMQIDVGDKLPAATFLTLSLPEEGCTVGRPNKIESSASTEPVSRSMVTLYLVFDGKTVVLVGVPGAFTPTVHTLVAASSISAVSIVYGEAHPGLHQMG
jgi:hypothetical protein